MREKKLYPSGTKFGFWTIIKEIESRYVRKFEVKCDCGIIRIVQLSNMKNGASTSCGSCSKIKHGHGQTPIYYAWARMISRCYNPRNASYKNYATKNIKVCERWHDVSKFVEDNLATFQKGLQIDRIDNDGDYTPENCRWVTSKIQGRNRGNNVLVTFNGETKCVSEWAEQLGMTRQSLHYRLKIMTPEQAISLPRKSYNKRT